MDFFGAFRAPGWPETDSPRKMIASSGVETEIRALGARFVAIFRFRKICDVDYNLSSKKLLGLDRDRPMLFEQVARRLINLEEHEYSLANDQEPYKAARQSRFNNPEIIAVLGDVIRRLRLLKGTRAAIGRKGFRNNFHTGCNQLGNFGKC